jgi:hypothetical protein
MRPLLLLAALLLIGLCAPLRSEEIKKGRLAPTNAKSEPQNVPGAFHPYNVTTREKSAEELEDADKEAMEKDKGKEKFAEEKYTSEGKYHCLVTEYDLDPVVMLFARGLNDSEGFKELLTKLDAACSKFRVRRLRAFVVFLDDELPEFHVKDDLKKSLELEDRRKEVAGTIRKIADDLKLKNVVLTLGAKDELKRKNYDLGDAALTAVLYKAFRIRSSHALNADDLNKKDAPAIDVLMKDVEKHLVSK